METENDKTIVGKLETLKHIHKVRALIFGMIQELDNRARNHDLSKLESPEKEIFGEFTPELAKTEYGSQEYKDLLAKVKPAIDHHYSKNRHHPEHWPVQESEYDEVMSYINQLKSFDPENPSIKWLESYAKSLNSRVNSMTLIDILEMLVDWKAAGERNKNGNIRKSLEVNTERYGLSPQLKKIMENTVREHFKD